MRNEEYAKKRHAFLKYDLLNYASKMEPISAIYQLGIVFFHL
jgi:hypothetical protein